MRGDQVGYLHPVPIFPVTNRTLFFPTFIRATTFSYDEYLPHHEVANIVCGHEFDPWDEAASKEEVELLRKKKKLCQVNLIRSLRSLYVYDLSHFDKTIKASVFNRFQLTPWLEKSWKPQDLTNWALTYVYELGAQMKRSCFFGEISIQNIITAMHSNPFNEIWIFVEKMDFSASLQLQFLSRLAKDNNRFLYYIVYSKENIEDLFQLKFNQQEMDAVVNPYLCDTFHFNNAVNQIDNTLETFKMQAYKYVSRCNDPCSFQQPNILIVDQREYDFDSLIARFTDSPTELVDWIASSVWLSQSSVFAYPDSQNFYDMMLEDVFLEADSEHSASKKVTEIAIGSLVESTKSKIEISVNFSRNECFHHPIIVSYTNRVFGHNAIGIKSALEKIGYTNVQILSDLTISSIQSIARSQSNSSHDPFCQIFRENILQIAIGPHESTLLLKYYIVFQMEQIWSVFYEAYLSRYKYVFKNSIAVWALSKKHAHDIHIKGNLSKENIFIVPLYIDDTRELPKGILVVDENNIVIETSRPCMFGSNTPRRNEIIQPLLAILPDHDLKFGGSVGHRGVLPFDYELDLSVSLCELVLNIHGHKNSSLEVHRINYLLSVGQCVVSERSTYEPEVDKDYEDAVIFVDPINNVSEFALSIKQILDSKTCSDYQRRAKIKSQQIQNDLKELRNAIQFALQQIFKHETTNSFCRDEL